MSSNPLDDLCDAFEEQWQSGNVPSLEEWLGKVSAEQRSELLKHLLPIDVWWRRRQEQEVTVSGYLARFPEYRAQLLPLFRSDDTIAEDWNPFDRPTKRLEVGNYQLLQMLGRGGMGTVWLAQRAQPIKQRVALKLIRKDLNRHEVLKRFEIERQALSMMNHPNIARILDVGTTEDGQPYFAMEYVQGIPITSYCDQYKLSIDDRLKLFQEVCLGVQHAHQKGIIHRDLKPSNILVGQLDGRPAPKIIDFGLAKALDGSQLFADQTLFTSIGQVLGTVRYMSPEQASMGATDVDTRSDIFSLGIILYELLTGTTPLDDSSIKEEAVLRVLEMIREKEAIRPSKKLLSSTAHESSTISQLRRTDSVRLTRVLRGELDWIVMKSLEKDRSRRYETAAAFAEDIYRYLNSQPIKARPPSWFYQTSKFVRRNQLAVFTSAFIMLALISAVVVADWGMRQAKRALKKQEEALKDAESVSDFFTELLSQAGPNAFGDKLTVVDAVEKRRQELIDSEVLPPRRKVHFLSVLLDLYIQLDDGPKAQEVIQEIEKIVDKDRSFEDREKLVIESSIASVRWISGDGKAAIKQLEVIIDPMRQVLGSDSADFLGTYQNLGMFYANSGEDDRAERILGEIVERPGNLTTDGLLMAKSNLAILWNRTNRTQQGLDLLRTALKEAETKLGPSHSTTLFICQTIGSSSGDREEVLRSLTRATNEYSRIFGDMNNSAVNARQELLGALCNVGKWKEAIPHGEKLLKVYSQKLDEAKTDEERSGISGTRSIVMKSYLMALTEDRQYEVAIERLRDWIDVELGSQSDREKFFYRWLLVKCCLQRGQLELAEQEILRIGWIEGLAEIEKLEKEMVEFEFRLRKSIDQVKQEKLDDVAQRANRLAEILSGVDVIKSLDTFYQRAEKESQVMKVILQSDVADIFSLYYNFVGNEVEAENWRKRNPRR